MLMRRSSGRPVVAELGRELLAAPGGRVAPAACGAPVATAAADGDMEEAEVVVGAGVADPTASLPVSGASILLGCDAYGAANPRSNR